MFARQRYDTPRARIIALHNCRDETPRNPWEPLYPWTSPDKLRERLADVEETTLVAAHTHVPMDLWFERWHVVNPGSVGLPLAGAHEATYLILDGDTYGWRATWRRGRSRACVHRAPAVRPGNVVGFLNRCGSGASLQWGHGGEAVERPDHRRPLRDGRGASMGPRR